MFDLIEALSKRVGPTPSGELSPLTANPDALSNEHRTTAACLSGRQTSAYHAVGINPCGQF